MTDREPSLRHSLHRAFRDLIERADGASAVDQYGLTPRELGDRLSGDDRVDEREARRIVELLEQNVYARGGAPEEIDEGVALCRALAARFPEIAARAEPPQRRQRRWLARMRAAGGPLLAAGAVVVLGVALVAGLSSIAGGFRSPSVTVSNSSGSFSSPSASRAIPSGWKDSVDFERAAVRSHTDATGVWATPRANPTVDACAIPDQVGPDAGYDTGIDLDTGSDGVFANARDEDPFRPPLGWTHRTWVSDRVSADGRFIRATAPQRPALGVAGPDDQQYEVEVTVFVAPGQPTAIPSPAADAIVTRIRASKGQVTPLIGGGDELQVTLAALPGTQNRVTLRYHAAHASDYHGAPLPSTPFNPIPAPLPTGLAADADVVIERIGALPAPTFSETVRRLHAYFAGFVVAPLTPQETRRSAYLTVALSRKGVCRHRSRTFVITAMRLGVPVRLVENRIHSFAEVRLPDGNWRRLEFRLGSDGDPGVPASAMEFQTSHRLGLSLMLPALVLTSMAIWMIGRRGGLILDDRLPASTATRPSDVRARLRRSPAALRVSRNRILIRTRSRLRAHLALAEDAPREDVERALGRADMPPMVRRYAITLLEYEANERDHVDAAAFRALYWECRSVLSWIRREERS